MLKERFDVFFNGAHFAEPVLINGKPVQAIVDREYAPDNAFGVTLANTDPQLVVADESLPADIHSAEITARGKLYAVAAVEQDGTGVTVIQLRVKHEKPTY